MQFLGNRSAVISLLVTMLATMTSSSQCLGQVQVNMTTWHNDNWRTGQNTSESVLNTSNVNSTKFGRLCRNTSIQGQIYPQPLVLGHANGSMTVYVADEADYVYAFTIPANWNGSCSSITSVSVNLLQNYPNEYPADCHYIGARQCQTVSPTVGVLGTPAIDVNTGTLYLVAESQYQNPPTAWHHRLHALDTTTLAEKTQFNSPVEIPSVIKGNAQFQSQQEIQRPGLLWMDERIGDYGIFPAIFIAFSMMDGTTPHPSGWVFAYDAQNLTYSYGGYPLAFATVQNPDTNNNFGGGIWQGGGGLAAGLDANDTDYLYLSTADGLFDNTNNNYADSFLKLTTNLQLADYFTPSDSVYRWCDANDLDYGSGGVMALPADPNMNQSYQHVAIKADKENFLWVVDRTDLGGYTGASCGPGCTQCTNANNNIQTVSFDPIVLHGHQARSTPAFWDDGTTPFLYFAPPYGQLSKYPLNCKPPNGPLCQPTATSASDPPDLLGYAATPSVSSKGTTAGTGIVWAIDASGTNSPLYALDAESLAVLYKSHTCPTRDAIGSPTKFSVPAVANGYVFVGTQTDFDIFGPTTVSCN